MEVYLVFTGDYEDYCVEGVCGSKKSAELFLEKIIDNKTSIKEFEVYTEEDFSEDSFINITEAEYNMRNLEFSFKHSIEWRKRLPNTVFDKVNVILGHQKIVELRVNCIQGKDETIVGCKQKARLLLENTIEKIETLRKEYTDEMIWEFINYGRVAKYIDTKIIKEDISNKIDINLIKRVDSLNQKEYEFFKEVKEKIENSLKVFEAGGIEGVKRSLNESFKE